MDLELRQLRVFLTVASELHFSRAARHLHVSQPALSQQIRSIEKTLGVPLFSRTSRMVELTAAGAALRDAAPRVLFEADRASERVRQAAEGAVGSIVVGSVGTALASLTPAILRAMRSAYPQLRLEVSQMDTAAQLHALVGGRIDVGLVRSASTGPALRTEKLAEEPLVVALPEDHRLVGQTSISPEELAEDDFVLWPRQLGTGFYDLVIGYCQSYGFSPRVVAEGNDIETQLALVAAGLGVSLQPSFYAALRRVGVEFRPLRNSAPMVALQLVWRAGEKSAAVAHFVEKAREVAAAGKNG